MYGAVLMAGWRMLWWRGSLLEVDHGGVGKGYLVCVLGDDVGVGLRRARGLRMELAEEWCSEFVHLVGGSRVGGWRSNADRIAVCLCTWRLRGMVHLARKEANCNAELVARPTPEYRSKHRRSNDEILVSILWPASLFTSL
jgi:hypothetical protein